MPDSDRHSLHDKRIDPGLDHDPALGDPEDPADDRPVPAPLDGGMPVPTADISGEDPGPATVNQLPVSGSVNWQPPADPVTGYNNEHERERASRYRKDIVPNGR